MADVRILIAARPSSQERVAGSLPFTGQEETRKKGDIDNTEWRQVGRRAKKVASRLSSQPTMKPTQHDGSTSH